MVATTASNIVLRCSKLLGLFPCHLWLLALRGSRQKLDGLVELRIAAGKPVFRSERNSIVWHFPNILLIRAIKPVRASQWHPRSGSSHQAKIKCPNDISWRGHSDDSCQAACAHC